MSQDKEILKYLKSGNRITALEALRLFGCFRLASRIHTLKASGEPIQRQMIKTESGKIIAQYYIENTEQEFQHSTETSNDGNAVLPIAK